MADSTVMPKQARLVMAMQEQEWNRDGTVLTSGNDCYEEWETSHGVTSRSVLLLSAFIIGSITLLASIIAVVVSFDNSRGLLGVLLGFLSIIIFGVSVMIIAGSFMELSGEWDGFVTVAYTRKWESAFEYWEAHYKESYWFTRLSTAEQNTVNQAFDDERKWEAMQAANREERERRRLEEQDTATIDRALELLDRHKNRLITRAGSEYALDTINDLQKWFRDEDTTFTHPEEITQRESEFLSLYDYSRVIVPAIRVKNRRAERNRARNADNARR